MKRTERIKNWAKDLTADQMRPLLIELVDFACDAEMVNIGWQTEVPYWESNGDPLVDGQKPFTDD